MTCAAQQSLTWTVAVEGPCCVFGSGGAVANGIAISYIKAMFRTQSHLCISASWSARLAGCAKPESRPVAALVID
jgi:hypothetical protein